MKTISDRAEKVKKFEAVIELLKFLCRENRKNSMGKRINVATAGLIFTQ